MRGVWRHIDGLRGRGITLALTAAMALGACERHGETEVRSLLTGWFDLGETLYFKSKLGCTAAVFKVSSDMVKSALVLEDNLERGIYRHREGGLMALRVAGANANQVANTLMTIDKGLGLAVLAANTQALDCMNDKAKATFFKGLSAPHSVLVYDTDQRAVALLVPTEGLVLFASGDS